MKRLLSIALLSLSLEVSAAVSIFQYVVPSGEIMPPAPGFLAESAVVPTIGSFTAATPSVTMALPGHPAPVNMALVRSESRGNGFTWVGRVNGYAMQSVVTVAEGHLLARLFTELGNYEIRTSSAGASLGTVDPTFRIVDEVVTPSSRLCCTSEANDAQKIVRAPDSGNDPIRTLVGYTSAARVAAGGTAQIQALAQYVIDLNNQIYMNSQVSEVRLQLAGTMEVNHADPSLSIQFLDEIRLDPNIADVRNATYADIVVVLAEDLVDVAGIAYGNFSPGPAFESFAFALSERAYAGLFVFAHEVGHLQGMGHYSLSAPAAYVWGHPHVAFVGPPFTQGFS